MSDATAVVETVGGALRGRRDGGIEAFLGIPYARAARFRPPEPPLRWDGVRDVVECGPVCPQLSSPLPVLFADPPGPRSEDCLRIHVWTPGCDAARRPVLVWVHGGGFVWGAGSEPMYAGAALARRGDAVVVSFNYRLGILGFLHHPELVRDQPGNWGSLDQIAALEWVRDHAERFGGDPARVTIFGESAGAVSVGLLASCSRARGLFQRAILQSGVPATTPAEFAAECAESALRRLDVGVRELERLPADQLLAVQAEWEGVLKTHVRRAGMRPVAGELFASSGFAAASQQIPVVTGTTADESRIFGWADPRRGRLDEAGLVRRVGMLLDDAPKVIARCRELHAARGESRAPWDLWCEISTDFYFTAPLRRYIAELWQAGSRVHRYRFDWASPFEGGAFGASHGIEVPFVMGTLDRVREFTGDGPQAERLAEEMQQRWSAFARSGDPSPPGALPWPTCGRDAAPLLRFGAEPTQLGGPGPSLVD